MIDLVMGNERGPDHIQAFEVQVVRASIQTALSKEIGHSEAAIGREHPRMGRERGGPDFRRRKRVSVTIEVGQHALIWPLGNVLWILLYALGILPSASVAHKICEWSGRIKWWTGRDSTPPRLPDMGNWINVPLTRGTQVPWVRQKAPGVVF